MPPQPAQRLPDSMPTQYDYNSKTYVEQGYNENPVVYSVIQQMTTKAASVPLFIQNTTNTMERRNFDYARANPRTDISWKHRQNLKELQKKAFQMVEGDPSFLPPPLERPNPHQTWTEFISLSHAFLRLTGNIYWYMPEPETGSTAGEPYAIYPLPSHLGLKHVVLVYLFTSRYLGPLWYVRKQAVLQVWWCFLFGHVIPGIVVRVYRVGSLP